MIDHLAIIGATGVVGREVIDLVRERSFPAGRIALFASPRSAGEKMNVNGRELIVEAIHEDKLSDVDIAIFSAGTPVSEEFAPVITRNGGVVVDNSSAFRMTPDVPLVIPEINADDIATHKGIVANPNCTTIMMLMAVAPIHRKFPIKRIVVSTYQAASGAGLAAMNELRTQTRDVLDGREAVPKQFPHPIAFNLFAHDSATAENGYNGEENKVVAETRKILHEPEMAVAVTCVRVPVLRAHSESINLEFHEPVSCEDVRAIFTDCPGTRLVDDRAESHFPMPVEASGKDDVFVGRIRQDISLPDGRGVELFVCGDQIRKGAALNALQIAERLVEIAAAT